MELDGFIRITALDLLSTALTCSTKQIANRQLADIEQKLRY